MNILSMVAETFRELDWHGPRTTAVSTVEISDDEADIAVIISRC